MNNTKNNAVLIFCMLFFSLQTLFAGTLYIDEALKQFYDADFDSAIETIEKSIDSETDTENRKQAYAYLALFEFIKENSVRCDEYIIKLLKADPVIELQDIEKIHPGFLEDITSEFENHFKTVKASIDFSPPAGEIIGLLDSYTEGQIVEYTIRASDNVSLKKVVFKIDNSSVKETWDITGQSAIQKSYFATKTWKPGNYKYLLQITDTADNTSEYQGTFIIKPLQYGYVNIFTKPYAEMFINGKSYGKTPKAKLKLHAGSVDIRFINKSKNIDVIKTIIIEPEQTVRKSFIWK
ncbi:immunoglobulin-like fold-containing [Desulfonema limicola]|uniref:Immunoglobulin-like fold-containing n=1 Tax=Desulfonema limicola TaxID=45656 RepID=A0A975BBW1_9BACT|nr:hypothetical protein [Desulfonema limicola]QTA82517.1 immunoglobulin-like fold-containing [Desulfonema limicola]